MNIIKYRYLFSRSSDKKFRESYVEFAKYVNVSSWNCWNSISMLMSRLSNNMRAETTVYTNLFVRNYLYKILNAQNHRNLRDSISLLGKRDIGNDSFWSSKSLTYFFFIQILAWKKAVVLVRVMFNSNFYFSLLVW